MPIDRLVRFVSSKDNKVYYGNANESLQSASVLASESPFSSAQQTSNDEHGISKLLCPLQLEHCPSIICIGLNYIDHAQEAGMSIPKNPVVFFKPVTALNGPYDDIVIPKISSEKGRLDYEAELVIVIGRKAARVSEEEALDSVFGYTSGNDFSNRAWQLDPELGGGQWCYSKSFDTSAPVGPSIVSKDMLHSASGLEIKTLLNGETMQAGNTENFIFSVAKIVSFLSAGMTLLPGTLIFTGTPAGVGFGRKPPVAVEEGDLVEVDIDSIGKIANRVVYEQQ